MIVALSKGDVSDTLLGLLGTNNISRQRYAQWRYKKLLSAFFQFILG